MKHEMPQPARIPVMICLIFASGLIVAMAAFVFINGDFMAKLRLASIIMLILPGIACCFARLFGWRRTRRPAKAEIRLNLAGE